MIVGATRRQQRLDSGSAYVVYGQNAADPADLALRRSRPPARGFRIDGQAAEDQAGTSVAAAGDPNNDGIDDVVVGAPFADNGGTDSGSAYVVYGEDVFGDDPDDLALATVTTTNATRGLRIHGQAANDNAGSSVAAAGDPNNDGIDDVIVGGPFADNGSTDSGSAYILGQVPSAGPGSLGFGTIAQGTTSPGQSFTVTNNELAPVSVDGFAFAGANPGDFKIASDTCHGEVEALTTCTASVRFVPQAQGTRTATLTALIDRPPRSCGDRAFGNRRSASPGPLGPRYRPPGPRRIARPRRRFGDEALPRLRRGEADFEGRQEGRRSPTSRPPRPRQRSRSARARSSSPRSRPTPPRAATRSAGTARTPPARSRRRPRRAAAPRRRNERPVADGHAGHRSSQADGKEEVIRRRLASSGASPPWSRRSASSRPFRRWPPPRARPAC